MKNLRPAQRGGLAPPLTIWCATQRSKRCLLWLLNAEPASGLFNVGTGKARTFADLARALFEAIGRPQNIQYVPTPEAIRDKYQYFTEAKVDSLRAAGYDKAFTELEAGVKRYVEDYLANPDPYR